MKRALWMSISAALAASTLSGCFFGLLKVQRDSSIPPAPVVDATVKVVRPVPARTRDERSPGSTTARAATPVAVAPAVASNAVVQPFSNVVHFAVDAYRPDPAFDALLRAHADQLKADPNLRVVLKGHGDARGGARYNRALAAKRAEMVARALRGYGVDAQRMTEIAVDDDPDSPDLHRVVLIYP